MAPPVRILAAVAIATAVFSAAFLALVRPGASVSSSSTYPSDISRRLQSLPFDLVSLMDAAEPVPVDELDSLEILALKPGIPTPTVKADMSPEEQLFQVFMHTYNRTYTGREYDHRLMIFVNNLDFMRSHNSRNTESTLGINQYADLTDEEFNGYKLGNREDLDIQEFLDAQIFDAADLEVSALPETWDWSTRGVVGPVENQGSCGSCWSFVTAGSIESLHAIHGRVLTKLSRQQLLDCTSGSCRGGTSGAGYGYAATSGVSAATNYPSGYTARESTCSRSGGPWKISGYKRIASGNEVAQQAAVYSTPLYAALCASDAVYRFYRSGVITGPCCTNLNHANLLVGWGTENGMPYWKLKNQWGSGYGAGGYVKIRRRPTATSGASQCGVAALSAYPYGPIGGVMSNSPVPTPTPIPTRNPSPAPSPSPIPTRTPPATPTTVPTPAPDGVDWRCPTSSGVFCYPSDCCPRMRVCSAGHAWPPQEVPDGTLCYRGSLVHSTDSRCANEAC